MQQVHDRMLRLRRARDPVGGRWYVQALLRVFLYPPPCGIIAETSYDVTLRRYARTPRKLLKQQKIKKRYR